MIHAIDTVASGALWVPAAVCHQIVVVFIENECDRLHVVAFLVACAGGYVYALGLFAQMEVIERDLLPADDGLLDAVHGVEDGFVGMLPGIEAYHVFLHQLDLMRSTESSNLFNQLSSFLFRDKAGCLHSVDQNLNLRHSELVLWNVVEPFLILQEAHNLEAVFLHDFNVQAQRPDITGNAHLIQPSAKLYAGDRMCFIRFFAQKLV